MIRVVLDTNVIVAAALTPKGTSSEILKLVAQKQLWLYVSQAVVDEYVDVLGRSELGINPARVKLLLRQLLAECQWLSPTKKVNVSPDPDDNVFLECAEAAKANYLVTGNTKHFPERWKYTKVVTARQFSDLLKSSPKKVR